LIQSNNGPMQAQGADVLGKDSRAANIRGRGAREIKHTQAENEVPQPHDFVA